MALLLDAACVEECVVMGNIVNAIEDGLREEAAGRVDVPPRLNVSTAHGFMWMMGAALNQSGLLGYKVFHGSIETGVRYIIAIHEERDGRLLALMDGAHLTAVRTGATTGVATRWMSAPDADCVAVLGSGLEAQENLLGVCAVRPIRRVRVFSPRQERRDALAARMGRQLHVEVTPFESPKRCIHGAPIVVVATNTGSAQRIAFRGAWMTPGVHVNSIGFTTAAQREVDPDTFFRAPRVVLDTLHAQRESGDCIEAVRQQKLPIDRAVSLAEVVARRAPARISGEEMTLSNRSERPFRMRWPDSRSTKRPPDAASAMTSAIFPRRAASDP